MNYEETYRAELLAFANTALAGLLSNAKNPDLDTMKEMAKWSFLLARLMMKESRK